MTTTERIRSDYLTAAVVAGGDPTHDFADLLADASIERVQEALATGFTRAIFNGVVAASRLGDDAETLLAPLFETYRRCSDPAFWNVVEKGEADLPTTLALIRIEIVESIGKAGITSDTAVSLLSEALDEDDDSLHFAVFETVRYLGPAASPLVVSIERYIAAVDERKLPVESLPHLRDAALRALMTAQ